VFAPARREGSAQTVPLRLAFERGFEGLRRDYEKTLEWALDHRRSC
jgi:hypothetical protein